MRSKLLALAVGAVVVLVFLGGSVYTLTDWIWLKSVGYSSILVKSLIYEAACFLSAALLAGLFVYLNLYHTRRMFRQISVVEIGPDGRPQRNALVGLAMIAVSGVVALFYGLVASGRWRDILMFIHSKPFGIDDPLFSRDIGFYIFRLPLLHQAYGLTMSLIVVTAAACAASYAISGSVSISGRLSIRPESMRHLALLAAMGFLVRALGYRLDILNLVYSGRGMVYGAGYTDAHVILPALNILTVASVAAAVGIVIDSLRGRVRLFVPAFATMIVASLLLLGVVPGIVERIVVKPNQADLESHYIASHIDMTQKAYDLDSVEVVDYGASDTLTLADLQANEDVISNIRLWDWGPMQKVYAQTQSSKAYYEFLDVDVDRYVVDGEYRQVMLSAREMNPDKVPQGGSSWINRHLVYTHGYGLVMSYANEISPEGFPVNAVQGVPPVTVPGVEVVRPEIYYGEMAGDYVIANNNYKGKGEFDYPSGEQGAYAKYSGSGGVGLSSWLTKLLFAIRFSAADLLLSDSVTSDSRLMMYRNVSERVRKIAPFLSYDPDPYLVLSEGRLYWVLDGYTSSSGYPYSQPVSPSTNYIRNSVKVVVDAYNGDVRFYRWDKDDPIAEAYGSIFPALFSDDSTLTEDLASHFRYPEGLFTVQSSVYATYHISDVSAFFNREDQWVIPSEQYQNGTTMMRPYYVLTRLPGRTDLEFVLMVPFSPVSKKNLMALLVAGCDGDRYGKLTLYQMPRQRTINGPMQIESLIDGDDQISKDLTLWNQQGSRVIRGNLMIVPIAESLLYVEPIFIEPEGNPFPVLKRVVASQDGRVVAERTLQESLAALFSGYGTPNHEETPPSPPAPAEPAPGQVTTELARKALDLFNQAKESSQRGEWARYGQSLGELQKILEEMASESGK